MLRKVKAERLKAFLCSNGMDIIAPVSGEIVGVYENEKDHGTGLDELGILSCLCRLKRPKENATEIGCFYKRKPKQVA